MSAARKRKEKETKLLQSNKLPQPSQGRCPFLMVTTALLLNFLIFTSSIILFEWQLLSLCTKRKILYPETRNEKSIAPLGTLNNTFMKLEMSHSNSVHP